MRAPLLLGALLTGTAAAADPPAWSQYGGPNRDFTAAAVANPAKEPARLWRVPLGPGTSGIAADGTALFTMYSVPKPKATGEGDEVVVCLDAGTGKVTWECRYPVARLKGQESFSGDPIRPQATPAVAAGRVCALGYTGQLRGLDAATGKVAWQHDLVKDFEATPVQFGFSASPLVVGSAFVVHVGGKQAAVVAFDAATGKVLWKSGPAEPSYASPVLVPGDGGGTIVQVTRDAVLGLSAADGKERWSHPLAKPGLTNVPTPLVLPKGRLLISGQGVLGTRLLEVSPAGAVKELWRNEKSQFFYSNWVTDGETVYGALGELFCGLNLADGKDVWRERGQKDATVVRAGTEVLALRGDGKLTRCRMTAAGLEDKAGFDLLTGRCLAAPTLVAGVLYARSDKEVTAVRLSGDR